MNYFNEELKKESTQYFILDTGKQLHRDKDFDFHTWNKHSYNLVNDGDLFIYRKTQKASPNNKFYFYGAGKIEKIIEANNSKILGHREGDLVGDISKPVKFSKPIYQDEINPKNLHDRRKNKDDSWQYFFDQYGMNKIPKKDFLFLLEKGFGKKKNIVKEENNLKIKVHQKVQAGDHRVPDSQATVKTRSKYQRIFREDHILPNYDYTCAVTGIKTMSLLTAAHILKWSEYEDERMNPQNGICLSKLVDKCFEDGLITIDKNYKIKISPEVKNDEVLYKELKKYQNRKIKLPRMKELQPNKDFLQIHSESFMDKK